MDSDSFIIHIITEDFYKDIANDFKRWFDTSNYDENDERPLPIGKNKKEIGFLKDELGRKIMKEFAGLRTKTQAYLLDDDDDDDDDVCKNKKAKRTKKCVIKRGLVFENYADSLLNDKIILKSQERFKSDHHDVYTAQINKIALSSNDDKRLQTLDRVTTYPHGRNAFKVHESGMMIE